MFDSYPNNIQKNSVWSNHFSVFYFGCLVVVAIVGGWLLWWNQRNGKKIEYIMTKNEKQFTICNHFFLSLSDSVIIFVRYDHHIKYHWCIWCVYTVHTHTHIIIIDIMKIIFEFFFLFWITNRIWLLKMKHKFFFLSFEFTETTYVGSKFFFRFGKFEAINFPSWDHLSTYTHTHKIFVSSKQAENKN